MTNKPIEGGNRKPSRLRFFLRLVLTISVCAYACILTARRCSVSAAADSVRLSLNQTLAYYGTEIPCVYYNSETNKQVQITFDYVGTSNDFLPPGESNFFAFSLQDAGTANSALLNMQSQEAAFLRYRCDDLFYPSVTADRAFFSSGASSISQYNFDFNPSVVFEGVSGIRQMVLVPVRSDINRKEPSVYSYRSGQGGILSASGYKRFTWRSESNGDIPYFIVPHYRPDNSLDFRPPSSQFSPPFADHVMYMAAYSLLESSPVFSSQTNISGFQFVWNWAGALLDTSGVYVDPPLSVEIWIQCPEIYGEFEPIVITTAPTTTTAPATTRPPYSGEPYVTTPLYTYNLLPIESNQQVQIDIMNENLQYNAGTFDGINIIIKQLDDIYNAIKASGKLTPEQIAGLEWDTEDLGNYVVNQLTTYTMASMNFNSVYRPFTSFMDIFDSYNWLDEFAILGGFSLAFGVFCWFVFRGRGGGA